MVMLWLLAGCGGSSSNLPPSRLKERAFVSNALNSSSASEIDIIDPTKDVFVHSIPLASPGASRMLLKPDHSQTLVYDSITNVFTVIDNASESPTATLPSSGALPQLASDFVILSDNNTVFAAIRNAPVSGQPSGEVVVLSISDGNITASIPVPHVRRLSLSHNGSKLLAFADDSNSVWLIDTAAKTATAISGFDRATWGVFSSDDSTAYILSCGAECGGTTAAVTPVNLSNNSLGAAIPVSAATVALLDSNNLYVAGSGAGGGAMDIINVGSLSVAKSGIAIGDGFHDRMVLGPSNKLFIGARGCATGCLSIFDTSAQSVVVSAPDGDITGMQPIPDRNVMYVIEGGELVIYDATTSHPQSTQVDIVGQASDVVVLPAK